MCEGSGREGWPSKAKLGMVCLWCAFVPCVLNVGCWCAGCLVGVVRVCCGVVVLCCVILCVCDECLTYVVGCAPGGPGEHPRGVRVNTPFWADFSAERGVFTSLVNTPRGSG
jgi:hypothetical protein